jgi:hypothetical protein
VGVTIGLAIGFILWSGLKNYLNLRGLDTPLFFVYYVRRYHSKMNTEKVNLIIRNMELLIQSLKEEIAESAPYNYEEIISYIDEIDVDEYYSEEDENV